MFDPPKIYSEIRTTWAPIASVHYTGSIILRSHKYILKAFEHSKYLLYKRFVLLIVLLMLPSNFLTLKEVSYYFRDISPRRACSCNKIYVVYQYVHCWVKSPVVIRLVVFKHIPSRVG